MESLFFHVGVFFFILVLYRIIFYGKRKLPPSPFALPIIGHLHLLKKKSLPLALALECLLSKFGPIISLKLGCRPVVVVSSPSAVEECFTKNDLVLAHRPKSMAGDHFTYDYSIYVWASYGDLWRNLRRLTVVEMFCSSSLQKTSAIREDEVRRLLRRLFKISGDGKQKVDMKYLISLLICNIMMRIGVGKRCVEEGDEDSEVEKQFFQEFKDRFYPVLSLTICDFVPILRMIGFRGIEKNMKKMEKLRDQYLENLLGEVRSKCRNSNTSESKERRSMVETLLDLQQLEPEYYSDKVIKSTMVMMFIAGVDTSGSSLEWAMSLLLNHPQVMQKLKAEIEKCVGNERLVNELDLVKLPYLSCVVKETLRLYPPGPLLLPHLASEACTIGGFEIQEGTTVMVHAWSMHRDPSIWEDPNEFKPERFEGDSGEQPGSKYVPFGMGRRVCPAAAMATRTLSLALGALIQCFKWENDGLGKVDMSPSFGNGVSKAEPLCALCSPNRKLVQLLSQL